MKKIDFFYLEMTNKALIKTFETIYDQRKSHEYFYEDKTEKEALQLLEFKLMQTVFKKVLSAYQVKAPY